MDYVILQCTSIWLFNMLSRYLRELEGFCVTLRGEAR